MVGLLLAPVAQAVTYNTETFLSQPSATGYLDEPRGSSAAGDTLYVADTANNRIEQIDSAGTITTFSGTGALGYHEGTNSNAQFSGPTDVTSADATASELFVADAGNNVIRKITGGQVTTLVSGLSSPQGVAASSDTVYISDTGHNRIISVNHTGGSIAELATNLSQPTKLLYWPDAQSLLFVNSGDATVRALNLNTKKVSTPLFTATGDGADIGGIFLQKRNLYITSSYSIGVFNELWKVRFSAPNPNATVTTLKTTKLSHERETENLNWGSDISVQQDTVTWEQYYSWDPQLASVKKSQPLECLPIQQAGQKKWRKSWKVAIDKTTAVQSAQYILKSSYQGDQPKFRVKLQYNKKNAAALYETSWKSSPTIAALTTILNPAIANRGARTATLLWDAVTDATYYKVQLLQDGKKVFGKKHVTTNRLAVPKKYLTPNTGYSFQTKSCTATGCGDWSSEIAFRTLPAKPRHIGKIVPAKNLRISKLANGNFLTTLQFKLRHPNNQQNAHLQAVVQLCSTHTKHPKTVTANRIYVLYKGGSAVLVWHADGTAPQKYAGAHRFQDTYGSTADALLGRPKALAFNSNQTKLYIAENNKLAVYDFATQQLSPLAGHVMDSYTEATGADARFSDITAITLSADDKTLYLADRNNNRIRSVDVATGTTHYITGAGDTNFSFKSDAANGYAEGKACANELDTSVAGCAYFNRPTGLAVSPDGKTLYVADASNNRVRAVTVATGQTSLVAGDGTAGFKNGTGSGAEFNGPYSVDVSKDGKTLYVADKYNHAIRAINLLSKAVTTVVGTGSMGHHDGSFTSAALAIPEYVNEDNGIIYWTEAGTHTVRAGNLASKQVVTLSGNTSHGYVNGAGSTAEWNNPKGMAIRAGKLYVADMMNDVIRTIQL